MHADPSDKHTDLLQGQLASIPSNSDETDASLERRSVPIKVQETDKVGQYLLTTEDVALLQDLLRHVTLERSGMSEKRRFRFQDLEFTRQLSKFDRQNPEFSSSQFRGFFTLSWLGVALLLVKVAANNWRVHGTIWGNNEIIRLMFRKDLLVLGLTDIVLCVSTVFCLGLQRAIRGGYLHWNGLGWVLQNVCILILRPLFSPLSS